MLDLQQQSQQKQKYERRFQQVQSGAKNCIFIRTTLQDPLPLSIAIMNDIIQTQKQQTKRLLRMIPVQKTCKAYAEDIEKAVEQLAKSYFEKDWKTFYIVIKIRNNNSVKRDELTALLVKVMQDVNPKNTPDMKTPDVVLNVDVIKNICCLSILPEYLTKYGKYNLVVLANQKKEENVPEVGKGDGEMVNRQESDNKEARICEENVKESDTSHTAGMSDVCGEAVDENETCDSTEKNIQNELMSATDSVVQE